MGEPNRQRAAARLAAAGISLPHTVERLRRRASRRREIALAPRTRRRESSAGGQSVREQRPPDNTEMFNSSPDQR